MIVLYTTAVKNENVMELCINDKVTIHELQKQFSSAFPYLKIEFFDIPPTMTGLPKLHMYSNQRTLGSCRKIHTEGTIHITPAETVESLETTLWKNFGLSAEVFRKSGNLWIETTLSDSWTLKRQNDEGKAFSSSHIQKDIDEDPLDRDKWQ